METLNMLKFVLLVITIIKELLSLVEMVLSVLNKID